jgi:hypothetical protein
MKAPEILRASRFVGTLHLTKLGEALLKSLMAIDRVG